MAQPELETCPDCRVVLPRFDGPAHRYVGASPACWALYGVLERGVAPENALWIRRRALRDGRQPKHSRFRWLTPPSFEGSLNVADLVQAPTPEARAEKADTYQVWELWAPQHEPTVAGWYEAYVLPDRL